MKPNQIKNKKNLLLNKRTVSLLKDRQLSVINGGNIIFPLISQPTSTVQLTIFRMPEYL